MERSDGWLLLALQAGLWAAFVWGVGLFTRGLRQRAAAPRRQPLGPGRSSSPSSAFTGYLFAVAALQSPEGWESSGRLSVALWPQAASAVLWAATAGIFASALPLYGSTYERGSFALQAGIFAVVFVLLALPLMAALRQSARAAADGGEDDA